MDAYFANQYFLKKQKIQNTGLCTELNRSGLASLRLPAGRQVALLCVLNND